MLPARVTQWKWLRNGQEAFPAMLAAIAAAQQSIRLEIYIFAADELGQRFRDALVQARYRGVKVKVLVDGIGNHRKLLVCDEQTAFIGGFNIAKEYDGDGVASGWCDLGLQFEGELAKELAVSF